MGRKTDQAPVDAEGSLTIGQVAERLGLEQSAIRYYERIGLLPAPARERGWAAL